MFYRSRIQKKHSAEDLAPTVMIVASKADRRIRIASGRIEHTVFNPEDVTIFQAMARNSGFV